MYFTYSTTLQKKKKQQHGYDPVTLTTVAVIMLDWKASKHSVLKAPVADGHKNQK